MRGRRGEWVKRRRGDEEKGRIYAKASEDKVGEGEISRQEVGWKSGIWGRVSCE